MIVFLGFKYKEKLFQISENLWIWIYVGIEFWIGKTKKIKANSLIEIAIILLKKIFLGSKEQGDDMLEGKELEGKIGEFGGYSVDVTEKLDLEVSLSLKVDILGELEKLAAKSGTKLDDSIVAYLKQFVGKV